MFNQTQYLQHELSKMNLRFDAKYTAILQKQLEFVEARTYDVKFAEYKYARFIPIDSSVPLGPATHTYRQYEEYGEAKVIANFAEDLPLSDVLGEEFHQGYKYLGSAYHYSIQDLNAAAFSGTPLDQMRAMSARRSIETRLNRIGALGDVKAGLKGMLNHPNVPISQAVNGDWLGIATPQEILRDLQEPVKDIIANTIEIHAPDSILLPPEYFAHVSQTFMSNDNSMTILAAFLANNPYITSVDSWHFLSTGDAAGTGPRMVVYKRDPEVLQMMIPRLFEALPPQADNLAFKVPVFGVTAGVICRYPLAMMYVDGIGA